MRYKHERAQRKPRAEPESEPESESKPEGEPGSKNDAAAEHTSVPENKSNAKAETEPTPENWPEPGPRWEEAYEIWQWAWGLHVYLFATICLCIGLYAGFYVIANIYDGLQGKYLSVSLNALVAVFGFTRAFVMYLDPYHQGGIIHNTAAMRVVWSLAGPCLTASDCLVILALIETAKISVAPPKLQKLSTNIIIICFHFVLVITTDCVVADYVEAKAMLLFCQLFFVTWGSVLGTLNFVLGYKLDKQLFSHKNPKETADKIYIYLIYASGVANYILCAIIVYSAFGVFGVYSNVQYVDAWPWWAFQTLSRCSEIIACVLIFTVSAKRTRVKDAVAQVTGEKCLESISAVENGSSQSSKERLAKCFKRRKKVSRNENGSAVSLFTALREMALAQATGEDWHGTNPVPRIAATGECWVETKTMCSIIHMPGATELHSHGNKFDDLADSEDEEQESNYLELKFRQIKQSRRSSMFTALHEAKKSRISLPPLEKDSLFNNAVKLEEEIEKKNENSDKNSNQWPTITLPNEPIVEKDR
ncbi:uncharacterized protein LOC144635605 [Oculina patagonica]